jgi:hypothetical protein
VPVWVIPAIVVGLATLTGSPLLLSLLSIVAMMWVFAIDDGRQPPRRKALGGPPPGS